MTVVTREDRAANYAVKLAAGFRCAGCQREGEGLLVVTVKASGELECRCERCIDGRSHEVRPGQWDEASRRELAARART